MSKIVVVAQREFKVIQKSVSKTDKKDARMLAFYLSKETLPEARMNKVHGLLNGEGIKLKKESLAYIRP